MTKSPCMDCRDWRICNPADWFAFNEVRFCSHQVLWLLKWGDYLRSGHWPPEPEKDENKTNKRSTEATFVKPELIIAEVSARLALTGVNGKLLVALVEAHPDVELQSLDRDARDALYYVSGWRRRRVSFGRWRRNRGQKMSLNDIK